MTKNIFGYTSLGLPILSYEFGRELHPSTSKKLPKVLILGGVHGDEIEGVYGALGLIAAFERSFDYNLRITVVPQFNIEGVLAKTRMNSRGVDLNRNMATRDWSPEIKTPRYHPGSRPGSEPETVALSQHIETEKPCWILSLHSWHPVLNVNGKCLEEAQVLSQLTGYKIDDDIGYPTPGCLGTYAGLERTSPTLTYEIERGLDAQKILNIHVPAILEALKATEKKMESTNA